jgi:casein kinase 1
MQNAGLAPTPQDRRKDLERRRDADWRRASQTGGGGVNVPSPALVRHGSKRKLPNALVPGTGTAGAGTPLSAAAQINVPISTPQNRSNQVSAQQHPYANVTTGDYAWDAGDEPYGSQTYGRASPMVSTVGVVPPAISAVRAQGNEAGVSRVEDYRQQQDDEPPQPKSSIWRILTCRCG